MYRQIKKGYLPLFFYICATAFCIAVPAAVQAVEVPYCKELLSEIPFLDASNPEHNRQVIRNFAIQKKLPAFEVQIQNDFVPVLLISKATLQQWSPLFSQTMGIAQSLHPSNKANHGYARLPGVLDSQQNPTAILMDLFSPAKAGDEATADTGYRFKSLARYFAQRKSDSREFVDLAYALSPSEREQFWLYHAAKRIALVRIQYAFDEHNNWWVLQQRRTLTWDGFEHCNNSRCGQNIDIQLNEIKDRVTDLLNAPLDDVLKNNDTRNFIQVAKKDLLSRDWRIHADYDSDFLNNPLYLQSMNPYFKDSISLEQKVDALSYLLAIDIFQDMLQLRHRLDIFESRGNQYGNPFISSILIYSDNPDLVPAFYNATVSLESAPSDQGNNGFDSNYFLVRKLLNEGYNP